ncbi:MAG: 40S ribosomal protein S17 [Nanoarchaeota archaeon]|nr:40S ribosomal protein S17 [Nanoarchaeota archaeon]
MGKIKSKLVKRCAKTILKNKIEPREKFEENKRMLKTVFPTNKLRNQTAGYLTKLNRNEKKRLSRLKV